MRYETEISTAIQAALGDSPNEIRFDGRFHRFPLDSSRDAGWYIAHSDAAVTFGDWRTGSKQTWFDSANPETPPSADLIALEARRAAHIALLEERAAVAARAANAIWSAASPAPSDHPYLLKKQIAPHFARVLTPEAVAVAPAEVARWLVHHDLVGALIIPAGNAGKLRTLQFIPAARKKMNLVGGSVRGACAWFGRSPTPETIFITEGFATGASVYEASKLPVVVAIDSGNLATVAAGIRRDYPACRIIIAADNDLRGAGDKCQTNTGIVKAQEAALRVGATVAIPQLDGKKCDFNDVAVALGVDEVNRQLQPALSELPPAPPKALTAVEAAAQLEGEIARFMKRVGTHEARDMAIRAAAGLGKTTLILEAVLEALHEIRLTVDYFVPSHKLAEEQVARLPAGVAIAIKGRTAPDVCAKHEAAGALQKVGLGALAGQLLCGKVDPDTGKRACPHASGCGYLKQFNSTAPIRFYAHEWLDKPERSNRKPDTAVIDETFRDALEHQRSWNVADLFAAGRLYRELSAAIADGNLLDVATANLAAIDAVLDAEPLKLPPVHPEMTADEALSKLANWDDGNAGERYRCGFLRAVKRAVEANTPLSLYHVARGEGAGKIYAQRTTETSFIPAGTPRLFIDASLSKRIIQAVSPDCEFVDIAAQRNAHVIQVADTALAKWRLDADNDHLSSRIIEFVVRKAGEDLSQTGAIVAPKDWLAKHGDRLPVGVKQAHFGALRGLNALEGCAWVIVVGRNEPPTYSVEANARAWFASDPAFQIGTATREKTTLVARNGDSATVTRTAFTDPSCQEILESVREQESLQALDRLRLIHALQPKTVYLLSNLPLPGLPPDELVTLDDLLLPGRLAEVMLRDFVITGPAMLAERHPDLFPTVKTAQHVMDDFAAAMNTPFPNKYSIWQTGYSSITIATYRTEGSRGGKPRRALVGSQSEGMAAALLEEIHGKPVTLLSLKPLVEPFQAAPTALTEIEEPKTLPEPPPVVWNPPDEDWVPIPPDPEPWEAPFNPHPEPLFLPNNGLAPPPTFALPSHLADLYAAIAAARVVAVA